MSGRKTKAVAIMHASYFKQPPYFFASLNIMFGTVLICAVHGAHGQSFEHRDQSRLCASSTPCASWIVPNFEPKSGFRRFLLSTRSLPVDVRSLAIRLPTKFAGEETSTPTAIVDTAFFIWPDLTSANDNKNFQYRQCINNCGGRMLVRLSYEATDGPSIAQREFDLFIQGPAPVDVTFIRKQLTSGFNIALSSKLPAAWKDQETTAYYLPGLRRHPSIEATCSDTTPFLVCEGYASSTSVNGLSITVTFEREYLPKFIDFQERLFGILNAAVVAKTE